jgi:hypothetical protein
MFAPSPSSPLPSFAKHIASVAIVVALVAASARLGGVYMSAQSGQSPPVVAIFTDYELPPSTLDKAWDKVPVIAHVRVQSSTSREKTGPRGLRVPYTEQRVIVLEVFKGAEVIGAAKTLTVNQQTAGHEANARGVTHESGGRAFKTSEEYVLFLEHLPGQSGFGVAWGDGGAYAVDDSTVAVPGVAKKMWLFRDELSRQDFLTTLRTKRDKRHAK